MKIAKIAALYYISNYSFGKHIMLCQYTLS